MRAVQINRYSKAVDVTLTDVPKPSISDSEVLIRVEAAAVNPVDILIMTGSVKLIQDYPMPLTLGNECSGVIEQVGGEVRDFQVGDRVCSRLPIDRIGAFAEYVAVGQDAIARMPEGCDFLTAAAIPLTGLTAYQAITEELEAVPGQTVLIPGGSGSFGQMAVPIAKALGLHVIVTGNARARERVMLLGADQYLEYKNSNYWEQLSDVDHVIDTLGPTEFEHELSVLRRGGRLVSLRTGPNGAFAERMHFSFPKKQLFSLAGTKLDRAARRQGKEYRFVFVRSDGEQLREVTKIVEERQARPAVDPRVFTLGKAGDALRLVAEGTLDGKVVIRV